MEIQEKITENLILHYTESLHQEDVLVAVDFNFSFYNQYYHAVIAIDSLSKGYLSVNFAEGNSELFASFESNLDNNEDELLAYLKQHIDYYEQD
ncbi:hypothetical protein BN1088_1431062 [Sphingobacterium sp. PM2-P1-29]|nr:hypothetical protein BN1088_1431062 [Sphingobacterium sp. PM2-P1-29]